MAHLLGMILNEFCIIQDQRETFLIASCDVMGASAAADYAGRGRPESPRKK